MRLAILALLAPLCTAAAQRGSPPRSDTTVKLAGAPRYAAVATMTRDLVIGADPQSADYEFSGIRTMIAATNGNIWVIDGRYPMGTSYIRVFDSTGKFVRYAGRPGDGPGEFRGPTGLAELPDKRVVMRDDFGSAKLNVYTADGRADTTWTLNAHRTDRCCYQTSVRADSAGVVWMQYLVSALFADPQVYRLLRLRPSNGSILDDTPAPIAPAAPVAAGVHVSGGRGTRTIYAAYPANGGIGWHPSGHYLTWVNTRYAIDLRVPRTPRGIWQEGDPVVSIRRDGVAPVPVSAAEREDQRKHLLARVAEARGSAEGPTPEAPQVKPPIRDVIVGADGRLWVQVAMPSERYNAPAFEEVTNSPRIPVLPWREPPAFDVFERDGTYIGRAVMPVESWRFAPTLSIARGDTFWTVNMDMDRVMSVERWRVNWR